MANLFANNFNQQTNNGKQDFSSNPNGHPILTSLIPAAIMAGGGLAMGMNPFVSGALGLSSGINNFANAQKYKNEFSTFNAQRQGIKNLLPPQLQGMVDHATSQDQLNNIAKTYYPIIQGQNSIEDYNTQYGGGNDGVFRKNTQLNPFSDPTQAGKITSDLLSNQRDLIKQGTIWLCNLFKI